MSDASSPAAGSGQGGACSLCGEGGPTPLFRLETVPVEQARIYDDPAQARAAPTGELDLVGCGRCGFGWNRAFRLELVAYDPAYEGTQAASEVFRRFAREQALRVVRTFHLSAGDRVLELGCGQGEFLVELADVGGGRGTGFDPAFRGGELPDGVEIRAEAFPWGHPDPFHVLVCRMTLEHLPDPGGLLDRVAGLAGGSGAGLFVTVPDAAHIWNEAGFWDVYYEHVNYFTGGGLRRALRRRGFRDVRVERGFGGQYLEVTARLPGGEVSASRPAPAAAEAPPPEPADPTGLPRDLGPRLSDAMEAWRNAFASAVEAGRRVALWGGASKTVAFQSAVPASLEARVVDINPRRQGRYLPGVASRVAAPEELKRFRPHVVVAMNPVYLDEISRALDGLGLNCPLVSVVDGAPDVGRPADES